MIRTIKEASVQRYRSETHAAPEGRLDGFIAAYNYARRLQTLKGQMPCEYICKISTNEPDRFIADPSRHAPRLDI